MLAAIAIATLLGNGNTYFEPPYRIKANGAYIDVDHGHADIECYDFDKDGVRDLLVGQFGDGKLRIYKNYGTDNKPEFKDFEWFQAGGTTGKVPTG